MSRRWTKAPTPTPSIDPRALDAFHREMARREIDVSEHRLGFAEDARAYYISVTDPRQPPGWRGSAPGCDNWEVKVSRVTFEVLGVWGVR